MMERKNQFGIILLIIDFIFSVAMIPIICHHEEMESLFYISIVVYILFIILTIYVLNFQENKLIIGNLVLIIILGSLFIGCSKYDDFIISIRPIDGIEHYELEFRDYADQRRFHSRIIKYSEPVLTTVEEMRRDFPEKYETVFKETIEEQTFDMEDDTRVWVYVTARITQAEQIQFEYEELDVEPDKINIKTKFITVSPGNKSVGKSVIVVVSVIPAEQ